MILHRPTETDLAAARSGDAELAETLGLRVADGWASFRAALEKTSPALWGPRFFVSGGELVGWGGFKGAPADGVAELGYEIAPGRRGHGLATAAAQAMVAEAFGHPDVDEVIAHTLPEHNASTRVLEKAGFTFAGPETENGHDVWRWSLPRAAR